MTRALWTLICLVMSPGFAYAHKLSDSYLTLTTSPHSAEVIGEWDIALRDLEHVLGIDGDGDGAITWGELRSREVDIKHFAKAHLSLAAGKNAIFCPTQFDELLIDDHVDGTYAVLRLRATCSAPPIDLAIRYTLLADVDPNHRGLLDVRTYEGSQTVVLSPDQPEFIAHMTTPQPWLQVLASFTREGVSHILEGYDHILFLITLLLPAVVLFRNGGWQPRGSLREAAMDVTKIVTAFTLAHSCTLCLAALRLVNLPTRFVESAIAFTVVLGALNNVYPIVTRRRWLVALVFGLIHGFGFASVLADLGLPSSDFALALFGFNVGVELGQLAIVLLLVPVTYWARASVFYRQTLMPGGALIIAGMAAYWFVERAFVATASP
jgi:HupE / UreJ protein